MSHPPKKCIFPKAPLTYIYLKYIVYLPYRFLTDVTVEEVPQHHQSFTLLQPLSLRDKVLKETLLLAKLRQPKQNKLKLKIKPLF